VKITISRQAVEKLLSAFKLTLVELQRHPSEREAKMIKWFETTLSDDLSPVDEIVRKVNKLREEWARLPMTAMEMHSLHGCLECLEGMEDRDWHIIRDYLAYSPRHGERFYQVRSRDRFLSAPVDTLVAAAEWAKTHRKKPAATRHPDLPKPEETRREYKPEEFREMFRGILPEK
jgi:hypothetical protein